jgi:hypothetical protein
LQLKKEKAHIKYSTYFGCVPTDASKASVPTDASKDTTVSIKAWAKIVKKWKSFLLPN